MSESKKSRRQGSPSPLQRERIVQTALALVDRDGLKALSMRRLGAELGVDPMAVYYYIPNKEALLDAIVEAVMASIDLSVDDPSRPVEERVIRAACAYRDVLLAHANALPIIFARGPVTAAALRPVELLTGILRDAGLPPAEAFYGMNTIAASVRGFVGMIASAKENASMEDKTPAPEQIEDFSRGLPPAEFPHLREALSYSCDLGHHGFEFGLRALVRGLIAPTHNQRPPSLQ